MDESLRVLRRDPYFAPLIRRYGAPNLSRGKNVFRAVVRSIVYQQLSGAAAATILNRFTKLFDGSVFPSPAAISAMPVRRLRSAGLSAQKTMYIKDAAKKFSDGTIRPRALVRMTNEEVIEHLTRIHGIGIWSAHMLLIFTLNRLDVLPTGDLGIRKGFQAVYDLRSLPTHSQMERLAKPWRSHASVAAWYLWRVADAAKGGK